MKKNPSSIPSGDEPAVVKIKIMGNDGVGKSTLLSSFSGDFSTDPALPNTKIKRIERNGITIELQLWDRNEEYHRCSPFCRHSDQAHDKQYLADEREREQNAHILLFDLTNENSLSNLEALSDRQADTDWLDDDAFSNTLFCCGTTLLVGTKADLREERKIDENKIQNLLNKHPQLGGCHFEINAKESANLGALIELIVIRAMKNMKQRQKEKQKENTRPSLLDIIDHNAFWRHTCGSVPSGVIAMQNLIRQGSTDSPEKLNALFNSFKEISQKEMAHSSSLFPNKLPLTASGLYQTFLKLNGDDSSVLTDHTKKRPLYIHDCWDDYQRQLVNAPRND